MIVYLIRDMVKSGQLLGENVEQSGLTGYLQNG